MWSTIRDGLVVVDSGLVSDTFNKVLGARLADDGADARIDEALGYVRGTGRPFTWWVGPCSRPVDLEERLRRRGLRAQEYELGMSLELDRAPADVALSAEATIQSVATAEQLGDFAGVLARLADPPDEDVVRFFVGASHLLLEPDSPMRFFVAYVAGAGWRPGRCRRRRRGSRSTSASASSRAAGSSRTPWSDDGYSQGSALTVNVFMPGLKIAV